MPPVVNGLSSGTTALPSSGLTIGPRDLVGELQDLVARAEAAAAGEDGDARSRIDQVGGRAAAASRRHRPIRLEPVGAVTG